MKTNLPEFSAWTETDNLVTGRTNNPWNLERTPGGSSGGESAAIAAGMSPIGIGSDVAISVRGPAAFTGIAALKATHGRIPYTGHFPTVTSRWWHVGPMARTVRDVALGYSILRGTDGVDGYAVHARNATPDDRRIAGQSIRVGWVSDAAFGPVDPEITAAVASAAARLADLGCEVEEVRLPFLGDPLSALMTVVFGEIVPYVKSLAAGRESELHAIGVGIVERSNPSFTDFNSALTPEVRRVAVSRQSDDRDTTRCSGTDRQWHGGSLDSRHECNVAVQPDGSACTLGPVWPQLGEPAHRRSTGVELDRRGNHPATGGTDRTQGRSRQSTTHALIRSATRCSACA
jgi:Asp-tRNA(Asn)/Glu-tRNA(Gln) amidotransferase A subunit family amidase